MLRLYAALPATIAAARTVSGADLDGNQNENGNALARICREWADGR